MNQNIKQILRQMVEEWQIRVLPEIKPREVQIGDWFSGDLYKIVTVTGFRRVGKTYLLLDFAKKFGRERTLYLNLEDERLPKETIVLTELISVVNEYFSGREVILLLDEIQEIPQWSRWARRVTEERHARLVISGSSSKLSLHKIPTELRGRTISEEVFPLSYSEFKSWKGLNGPLVLKEYLNYGGFPEIVLSELGKKPILLDEYFHTFLLRDIIEQFRPRQEAAIRDLIRLLLGSTYYTFGRLTKSLRAGGYQIGKGTVANYLSWIAESFFLRSVEIHSPKAKSKVANPKKAYFADSYFVAKYASNFSSNLGRLAEEVVASHLFRKQSRNPNLDVFYWKDQKDKEVDFVLVEGLETKKLIQVSFVSSALDIAQREVASLKKAGKELGCSDLQLVTWEFEGELTDDKTIVKCTPLGKFLTS